MSEYLMAEASETLLCLLIVEILLFASCALRFFTSNLICVLLIFFLDAHMFKLHAQLLGVCYMQCACIIALIYCVLCDF